MPTAKAIGTLNFTFLNFGYFGYFAKNQFPQILPARR